MIRVREGQCERERDWKERCILLDVIISGEENSNNGDLLRIPLLKDVFERYPTTPINIDVKENNDELIREVEDETNSLNCTR